MKRCQIHVPHSEVGFVSYFSGCVWCNAYYRWSYRGWLLLVGASNYLKPQVLGQFDGFNLFGQYVDDFIAFYFWEFFVCNVVSVQTHTWKVKIEMIIQKSWDHKISVTVVLCVIYLFDGSEIVNYCFWSNQCIPLCLIWNHALCLINFVSIYVTWSTLYVKHFPIMKYI